MRPHAPQLLRSLSRLASQPSVSVRLQSAKPTAHDEMAHLLEVQVTLACGTGPQTFPHPPQLFGSPDVFAHVAPQHVWLGGHVPPPPHAPTHTPPEHDSPVAHARPQPPQLRTSLSVFVSQPFGTTRSQSAKPRSQRAMPQLLCAQDAVAWAKGPHARPHAPQFRGSLVSSTQSGEQQDDPDGHEPPAPQNAAHRKLSHV